MNADSNDRRRPPSPAIGPQPRRIRERELRAGVPTSPWRSRRMPVTIASDDHRRTLFRTLLRRAEGVPVELADGSAGTVAEVVFAPLGFDFWPVELAVETAAGRRRVPVRDVRRIDVRAPRISVGPRTAHTPLHGHRHGPERHHGRRLRRRDPVRALADGALAARSIADHGGAARLASLAFHRLCYGRTRQTPPEESRLYARGRRRLEAHLGRKANGGHVVLAVQLDGSAPSSAYPVSAEHPWHDFERRAGLVGAPWGPCRSISAGL